MSYIGISLLFSILYGIGMIAFYKPLADKKILIGISLAIGVGTFLLEHWGYDKGFIESYKWQLANMLIIPIAYIDLKQQIIPNKLLLLGLSGIFVLYLSEWISEPDQVVQSLLSGLGGAVLGGGVFFIASLFVKGGVGAGDTKMMFVLGFILGFIGLFNVLLYSMIISALTGIVLMVMKRKNRKDVLPLAPFTFLGVMLAILFGV